MIIALARSYMASGKYLISLFPFFFPFPKSTVLVEVTESNNRMSFISIATFPLSPSLFLFLFSLPLFLSQISLWIPSWH